MTPQLRGWSRPDESAAVLINLLEQGRLDMRGPTVVARQLKNELVRRGLLHTDHYNEVMNDLMHGDASVMS